uniref:Uncharacterized protein n=1 Tax=Arundo donax TaxID=35708 RepID=A0A0A8YG78_ARUDO
MILHNHNHLSPLAYLRIIANPDGRYDECSALCIADLLH